MGVLTPGSAHARPSAQPPIDNSEIFQCKCLGGGQKNSDKFSMHFWFFSPKKTPIKSTPRGVGGVSQIFVYR
jgi:hypothetical protein